MRTPIGSPQYTNMNIRPSTLIFRLLPLLFVFAFSGQLSAQADAAAGKQLFLNNCASCHNNNMKDKMTGPALAGTQDRWEDKGLLYDWIRNSTRVIQEVKDPYAVALFKEYGSVMTSFPNLTDADIDNILLYIDNKAAFGCAEPPCAPAPPTGGGGVAGGGSSKGGKMLSWILFGSLLLLAALLASVIARLNRMNKVKAGEDPGEAKSFMSTVLNKTVLGLIFFGLFLVGLFFIINSAIGLGRQQDYAPSQPIAFSHARHAGDLEIECQYCHDGARRSKHATIPGVNTCMNCHKAVKEGPTTGLTEIAKIYVSAGFDPESGTYIEDYENYSDEQIAEVMQSWFVGNVKDDLLAAKNEKYTDFEGNVLEDKLLADAEKKAEKMWANEVAGPLHANMAKGLLKSNEENPFSLNGPIHWERIHNLPDHAYFNHQQHVTVGGVECETCHGPVDEMEVMRQHAPLSMGWCVNCHRQTEVQFADNPYYDSYELYHDQLEAGTLDKVTVEDIGGIECQKCHY